jgi:hypothetical protein
MSILNIDELLKEEEPQGFKIKDKEYTIPEFTHDLILKMAKLERELVKFATIQPMKDKDGRVVNEQEIDTSYENVLDKQWEIICLAVPNIGKAEDMKTKFTIREQQYMLKVIRIAQLGEPGKTAEEEELAYYRAKMGDTWREKKGIARKKGVK